MPRITSDGGLLDLGDVGERGPALIGPDRIGFLDNSVRGEWRRYVFDQRDDGTWRIVTAERAWRCDELQDQLLLERQPGRPTGFYDPDVHPELFEQVDGERRPRGPIAGAVPVSDVDWQELLSHPGRRKLQGGRVVVTESPALPPDAQAAADRALLREAMLKEQLEAWIEQRATAHQGLSPDEIAALQRLRARGPGGTM